jgi:hypothetical protein
MAKALFAHEGASSDRFTFAVMENVIGDAGLSRNTPNFMNDGQTLALMMREPYLTNLVSAVTKFLEGETANFVSFNRLVVDQSLWERASEVTIPEDSNPPVCEANLFALTRSFAGYITTHAFMGQAFLDFYPDLMDDVWAWDKEFLSLLLGAPSWIPLPGVSAAYAARNRIQKLCTVFNASFSALEDGREAAFEFRDLDDISEFAKERMRTWKKAGYSARAAAKHVSALLWAMNANAPNLVFWLIFHIYSNPTLLHDIREEMAPFVKASRLGPKETGLPFSEPPRVAIDIDGLMDSCQLLKATYAETARLDNSPTSYREITTDVMLSESEEEASLSGAAHPRSYHFRKGDILAVPAGAHHIDPMYFPEPETFNPHRFLVDDPTTGKKSVDWQTLRPFGDGATTCKGRSFAEREVLAIAAAIICLWDIEPVDRAGWKHPGHRSTTGVYRPARDMRVRLKQRI